MNAMVEAQNQIPVIGGADYSILLDAAKFDQMWRVAKMFACSDLVPKDYQGKPENVFVASQAAMRLQVDPFMFMQNCPVIYGKPGMEGKMVIALINQRGPFTGPIQWKFEGSGDNRQCTAYAKHKVTGEVCEMTIDWKTVKAEGWDKKSGSKWLTMPDQMFRYRTATWLARAYCPEVLMGLPSVDEIYDIKDVDGERIEEPQRPKAVTMPRAKKIEQAPYVEPAIVETIDKETGEIKMASPAAQEGAPAPITEQPTPSQAQQEAKPQKTDKQEPVEFASESQQRVIKTKLANAALSDLDLQSRFGFTLTALPKSEVNNVLAWISNPAGE